MNDVLCGLCGEPLPVGEEMFKYHGFSGPCPKLKDLGVDERIMSLSRRMVMFTGLMNEAVAFIAKLKDVINSLAETRDHFKSFEGMDDCEAAYGDSGECNCGADEWNTRVQAAKDVLNMPPTTQNDGGQCG